MGEDGHDHADHQHAVGGHTHRAGADADGRYLTIALLLIVGFMVFEVVVGIVAHSLALLSDAAHMLTDAGALALSLVVLRFVQRPGGQALTYGRRRAEVLSGQANGAVLLVLGLIVIYEAISRLITPPDVAGLAVTMVAAAGVVVNLAAAWVMAKAKVHDLHLWELAPGHPILTAHVLVAPGEDCHAVRRALEQMLNERFTIAHTTLQVDHTHQQLLSIQRHGCGPTCGGHVATVSHGARRTIGADGRGTRAQGFGAGGLLGSLGDGPDRQRGLVVRDIKET